MTATTESAPAVATVTATIDGITVTVPKGTLIIRAAEMIGIEIPRFCDHPLLDPVAMCRMCLVEVAPGPPKPQPACAIPLGDGMEVKTQRSSVVADKAQHGVMEFILANHPLDCPICDKGGECPLQNQAMTNGRGETRFTLPKSTFEKPINVSSQVLLDRERCVNCARCTRFADQIAGDPFIALLERGGKQQVGINPGHPFDSYFSGNTVQICPVGALTSAKYRFRARPFDLVSVPTVCEHCASGCALRTDYRRSKVTRRMAWEDPAVNEDWNCDKGRFAFVYAQQQRLASPMVRRDGVLQPASWPEAVQAAARGLLAARGAAGVLTGGRITAEEALAYSVFARAVLRTDNVDFRARAASEEEAAFLGSRVAGTGLGVTYADLQAAPAVVLVAFEPEDESPIVFLRLRKAVRKHGLKVLTIAPFDSYGSGKLAAEVLLTAPGDEAASLRDPAVAAALARPGAVLLVGERAAAVPGLLTALAATADATGARLAWVPRRAGERGALDAGLLPGLLPGGKALADPGNRAALAAEFGVAAEDLPGEPGLDTTGLIAALAADIADHAQALADDTLEDFTPRIGAVLVGGVDPDDLPDPGAFREALTGAFVVSLEQRATAVTELADVVLPVADVTQKSGTFIDWEGRPRPFGTVFADSGAYSDARVLALLADAIAGEVDDPVPTLFRGDATQLAAALTRLTGTPGGRPADPAVDTAPAADGVRLASWKLLIGSGTLQIGEPYLAAGAREPLARLSAATAEEFGLADGHVVSISTACGRVQMAVAVTVMPDHVVWVPGNAPGISLTADLGAGWGDTVQLAAGHQPAAPVAGGEA